MTTPPPSPYDNAFYAAQVEESLVAARLYAARLAEVFAPASVLDLGCGRGAWLKAFGEAGAPQLVGMDGAWNTGEMLDPAIEFRPTDLEKLCRDGWPGERFDLALSLEVAEHLPPNTSQAFVKLLCGASDVVIFGAAIPHQTGTHHVNLRLQSDWARDFAALGYAAWDLFRPVFWGRQDVPYWYQQNTFLFLRKGHALEARLLAAGVARIDRLQTMDVVHPDLLAAHADLKAAPLARRLAKQILPAWMTRLVQR